LNKFFEFMVIWLIGRAPKTGCYILA